MPDENFGGRTVSAVYEKATIFLAGVVLTLIGAIATYARDSITRAEVNEQIREVYLKLEQHADAENRHLENIDRTQVDMRENLARIGEHLGVPARHAVPSQ